MTELIELLIPLTSILLVFGIPLYAIKRKFDSSDREKELETILEQQKLEAMRQENFLLENKHMQLELDKLKVEREKDTSYLERENQWLLKEGKPLHKEKNYE